MAYLLDTNVFIQAKNLHYGFDFCPAFWEWLEIENDRGVVLSIEKIASELEAGSDELADWSKQRGSQFFQSPSTETLQGLARVSQWVKSQTYNPAAVNTFFQVADFYLVAHALAGSHVVVTHEIPANSLNKVKIPNVCIGLKIRCMTPFEMLRKERARFVLGRA
jgi:hypothetical protein